MSRAAAKRRQTEPAPGDERTKEPRNKWEQRLFDGAGTQGDYYRSDHDDYQRGGGQRRQSGTDTQERGKDQTDCASHLSHADEPQEQARQRHLLRHHFDRQRKLNSTGDQKYERNEHLNDPQRSIHDCPSASARKIATSRPLTRDTPG